MGRYVTWFQATPITTMMTSGGTMGRRSFMCHLKNLNFGGSEWFSTAAGRFGPGFSLI
jgi:hypothetical protein